MSISYLTSDATDPKSNGIKIIIHICNDIGGWGKGFVLAISKKWKAPELAYRNWFKNNEPESYDKIQFPPEGNEFKLGNVQFVKVEHDVWVANMIAQSGIKADKNGLPPVRYDAVRECLRKVSDFAKMQNASVHMPRIGCGLAGGKWEEIEPLIDSTLIANGVETFVYDFG